MLSEIAITITTSKFGKRSVLQKCYCGYSSHIWKCFWMGTAVLNICINYLFEDGRPQINKGDYMM